MVEQIKELRVELDRLAGLTANLKFIGLDEVHTGEDKTVCIINNSKQVEKAADSLYLAKAWLGKVLGELGSINPYTNDYKSVEDIVPTQDTYPKVGDKIKDGVVTNTWIIDGNINPNRIEKIVYLRNEIENTVLITNSLQSSSNQVQLFWFVLQHLQEARFYLGFELERLKKENK